MARIRTIKPEFPHSESMGRVSRDARLLFVLLWTICDDSGRTRAASRMLASLLFPYDDDAPKKIGGWLAELEREACLWFYDADGSRYLQIAKWANHQKIDKPSGAKCPPPDPESPTPREPSRLTREHSSEDHDHDHDHNTGPGPGPGGEPEGSGDKSPPAGKRRATATRAHTIPDDWLPKPSHHVIAKAEGVDCDREAVRYREHAGATGRLLKNWDLGFNTWLRRAREFGAVGGNGRAAKPYVSVLDARIAAEKAAQEAKSA